MPDARLDSTRATLPAGYQFPTPTHVHVIADFDMVRLEHVCYCGARRGAIPAIQGNGAN